MVGVFLLVRRLPEPINNDHHVIPRHSATSGVKNINQPFTQSINASNRSYMRDVELGAESAYPSEIPVTTPVFCLICVAQSIAFYILSFCRFSFFCNDIVCLSCLFSTYNHDHTLVLFIPLTFQVSFCLIDSRVRCFDCLVLLLSCC